jgi:hypothetical protein
MRAAQFLAIIGRGSKGSNALENTEDRAGATSEQQDNVINTVNSLDPYGPSWQLVPGNVAAGTVYAQVPTSGTGDLTFTRASTATRTNSAGTIVNVATGVPRIHYRNADGSISSTGRLLLEPQRTNLVLWSEQFDNAAWLKQQGGVALAPVVTANVELAPNGTLTADRIVFDLNGGTTAPDLSQLSTATFTYTSETRTQSIYLRTTDGTTKAFSFISPTGVATSITVTPTYQRFTYTTTGAGAGGIRLRLRGAASGEGTATSATVAAWAAQFEAGAYATTYIPTTTAAVTRLGDSTFKAGLSSLFGTEGTWFIEMSPSSIGVSTTAFKKVIGLFQVNGSISDCIYLEEYIATWGVFVRKGNATIVSRTYGTQPRKLAVTFGATGSRIYIDGVQAASTATNTSISPVQISTTQTSGSAIETVLNISQMAYFPTPLTQAQLAQITTL